MHGNHRLPFFFRLDDGRVVARGHSARAALVSGSAQAHLTGGDPRLLDLARQALDAPPGGTVLAGSGGSTTTIEAPSSGEPSLIGLRCPPATTALASSVVCRTLWPDGRERNGLLAWSIDRYGGSLALFRDGTAGGTQALSAVAGTLLDAARLALGLPTPPCLSPPVWFPDGVFLHRVMRRLARRDGPCTRRLDWASLSMLYPLNDSGKPLSSWLTWRFRQHFGATNTWASLRLSAAGLPPQSPAILPGLTPPVASWLDDGAFARWVLSRVPDVPSTLEWLHGHVRAPVGNDLSAALGGVDPAAPHGR